MKSYNTLALRGDHTYDDHQFQADMSDVGIHIPDHLLYKPSMNDYVLNEVYKQSLGNLTTIINPKTSKNYTPDEAREEASALRSHAKQNINAMMN